MNRKLYKLMNWPEIEEIVYADGGNPHRILGAHKVGTSYLVQTFQPGAKSVSVIVNGTEKAYPMELADEAGFYAVLIPFTKGNRVYHYHVELEDGSFRDMEDPYNYGPLISREDIIQFNSGIHYHIYEKLGAHCMKREGRKGVSFAVWAPNSSRVSVIGDFNGYDGRVHQMLRVDPSGIYEIFIPGIGIGAAYQFEIRTKSGLTYVRPDPYAFAVKDADGQVSLVAEDAGKKGFVWKDAAFIRARKKWDKDTMPLSICELSLDSFAAAHKGGRASYQTLAEDVVSLVKKFGFNAVQLRPVMEHTDNAFEVTAFFALKSAYGGPKDFMYFVNCLHEAGIRVILEWCPTFFKERECGLSTFDGRALYEYGDPQKARQPGSGYLVFDYGRRQVRNFLLSCALYWVERYHIDGLRLTDISKAIYLDYDRKEGEWTPNVNGGNENLEALEFMRQFNTLMHKVDPGILTITKETACWPQVTSSVENDGLGFTYKWNNGWSRDFLAYMQNDPIYRSGHHLELTMSMVYAYSERYILAFSEEDAEEGLESLISMMPGDEEDKKANLRFAYAYLLVYPGKKMLYLTPDDAKMDAGSTFVKLISDLNYLYMTQPALHEMDSAESGFEWINCISSDACMMSFIRKGRKEEDTLVVACNMAGVDRDFTVGVPFDGKYRQILNTDEKGYGGNAKENKEFVPSVPMDYDGRQYAIRFAAAPLSMVIFSYTPYNPQEKQIRAIKQDAELKKDQEKEKAARDLQKQHEEEEEKLLDQLRKRYEKELADQEKAIEAKYNKIQEERIFDVIADIEDEQEKAALVKTGVIAAGAVKVAKGRGGEVLKEASAEAKDIVKTGAGMKKETSGKRHAASRKETKKKDTGNTTSLRKKTTEEKTEGQNNSTL